MKYGIYADIHGNFDAAEVVLDYFKKENLDSLICAGDIVGYAAEPNKCVELVKDSESTIIAGNHDWASVELMDINYFNPYAKDAIIWTSEKLTGSNKNFLSNLELIFQNNAITMVHGSLNNPSKFNYIFDSTDAVETFKILDTPICFVAHTHVPVFFLQKEKSGEYLEMKTISEDFFELELESKYKYVFNVGSVGQPRDGNPKACCVIYDSEKKTICYKRIEYNVDRVQEKILKTELPDILAYRLKEGH